MGFEIQAVDTRRAPESLLRELSAYYELIEKEEMPDDPPTPEKMRIADWRNFPSQYPEFRWVLRDDTGIAAVAVAAFDTEQNLENGFGRVHVRADKRGQGYGRALATPMLDLLEKEGRHRFNTWVKQGEPAERLLADLGLKRVYGEKRSRLQIADLDRDLMRAWIERAGERAPDYELRYYLSPLPDDMIEKFCDLAYIMNTAPREDFEVEDEVLTPETWREREKSVSESQSELHTLIAVHQPTDDFAGYTQIKTQELQPELAWQWDTGVHPEHRNRGLGRWLKAAMIEQVVEAYPKIERVDTFNAGSNEPMLNINIQMGFKPVHIANDYQGDLATVRERFRA